PGTGFCTSIFTVSFTFYASGDCPTRRSSDLSVSLVSGVADPSSSEGPLGAGSYSFRATYGGDTNYNGSTGPCEPLGVGKANSSTSTDIPHPNHNHGPTAALGVTLQDKTNLTR